MTTIQSEIAKLEATGSELIISMTDELPVLISELKEKYPADAVPANLSDKESMAAVKAAIREIKEPRISLEKDRKALKGPVLELGKKIDNAARPHRVALEKLQQPWVE
jgi:hypothetical protein